MLNANGGRGIMSVFRQRRFGLLLLAVFISVMLVWKPWGGLEPQARGLNFGVDIAGGSRIILAVENATPKTQNDVIYALQARLDPYGTLGTQFRTLGENLILFESAGLDPGRTRELLTKQGRLEIFIENELVLTDEDIKSFDTPTSAGPVYSSIPIEYTEEGTQKLETAAEGKIGLPSVVYLDRPSDAILIFDEGILETSVLVYDNGARMFRSTGELEYSLFVSAAGTSVENLSPQALEYLESQAGIKLRVLLLGDMEDFTRIIENIPASYRVESIPKLSGESGDKWIKRACGVISDFPVGLGVGVNRIVVEADLQDARDLRAILSNKLPAELSLTSEAEIEARLGDEFVGEALVAGAVALAGVCLLIYFRYRHWRICLVIAGITLCELVITLGAASAFGLSLGLPELAGLLVVISTGIDHQLIVTDEMLRGGLPQGKGVSMGWRASRALPMVYAAIFMIIAVMIPIAWLGFGAIRGFTILTISGTILALLFTRPIYARIINTILAS